MHARPLRTALGVGLLLIAAALAVGMLSLPRVPGDSPARCLSARCDPMDASRPMKRGSSMTMVASRTRRSAVRTYTYRWGPIRTGDFVTRWIDVRARHPRVNGFVVGLHARLIDRTTGRPLSIAAAMLHHLYIRRMGIGPHAPTCAGGRTGIFYSTGEEDETLKLPMGYGYRLRAGDRWRMTAMIMSHERAAAKVIIEYTVTVARRRSLLPVQPFWLHANGCSGHVAYPVSGGGPPGSRDVRTLHWSVPFTGRIVAASGHLHGGAEKMWLSQPRCHGRRLLDTNPRYAMPGDLMYHLNPVLHEPGPTDSRMFLSRTGIPVREGETIDLHAAYDDHRPHWAVMAVMHVYVAPAETAPSGCRALPRDRRELGKPGRFRTVPPVVHLPLTRLDARGRPRTIHGALGPAQRRASGAVVDVSSGGFSVSHLSLPAGATLTWRFPEPVLHDVTFASGPRAVGSLPMEHGATTTVRFAVPGRYRFFCSLHPMTMHEVVDVGAG